MKGQRVAAEPTARERQIAELVAKGYSNRRVAEELVLSERTVEVHLSRIFSKLGVTSRTQLTLWVNEQRATMPPAQSAPAPPNNLPAQLTSFVGRDEVIPEIRTLVEQARLITIVGTGGVGKTRTAIQVGGEVLSRFPDGVWFVDLAPQNVPTFVEHEIASVLGIEERHDRALRELLLSSLQPKQMLLIVDNCEHVIDEAAAILEVLLRACPQLVVLATSREALRTDGERVFSLPSLAPEAATTLFIDRARACDRSFAVDEATRVVIDEICRRLDGVPLAVELAAAKVAMMSVNELSQRLGERFDLLTGGRRTALPRHQTLDALIGWSYLLLSAEERALYRRLSVFPSTWTLAACVSMCAERSSRAGEVVALVTSLVAKSIVFAEQRDGDESRFRLHESTREYGLRRLGEEGELDDARRGHADYVARFVDDAEARSNVLSQREWLALVGSELDNIRAAVEWTLSDGKAPAVGARIVTALGLFWYSRRYEEGSHWLELAVAHLDELEPELAARVLVEFVRTQPLKPQTLALAEKSVELYRLIDDPPGLCRALQYLGQSLINASRLEDAEKVLREAIALGRKLDDLATLGRAFALTGFARLYQGDAHEARALFAEAASLSTATGQDRDLALISFAQGELALAGHDVAGAVREASAALEAVEKLDDARAAGWQRCQLARALLAAGRAPEAMRYAREAVHDLRDARLPATFVEAILVMAAVLVALGRHAEATIALGFCARERAAISPFRIADGIERMAESAESQARAALAPDEFAHCWAGGEHQDRNSMITAIVETK